MTGMSISEDMELNDDGGWVKYTDHRTSMIAMNDIMELLENSIEEYDAEADKFQQKIPYESLPAAHARLEAYIARIEQIHDEHYHALAPVPCKFCKARLDHNNRVRALIAKIKGKTTYCKPDNEAKKNGK